MSDDRRARLVYSTGTGPTPTTGDGGPGDEPVPSRVVATLRVETKGRGGKVVTVVDGLPRNRAFVAALARDLKRALGTGGAARGASVELQGDRRETLREILSRRGLVVKG